MSAPEIAMVTSDLLFASKLRATLGKASLAVVDGTEVPTASTVFVDLNDDVERRLALIASLRGQGQARIVGFCQHDDRAVRITAMERGADQVVTNGSLQEAALRILEGASRPPT